MSDGPIDVTTIIASRRLGPAVSIHDEVMAAAVAALDRGVSEDQVIKGVTMALSKLVAAGQPGERAHLLDNVISGLEEAVFANIEEIDKRF